MTTVVDVSIALKWVLREEDTDEALRLWDHWQESGEAIIAPTIFRCEATNMLHQRTRRGMITGWDASNGLEMLLSAVAIVESEWLYPRTLEVASELHITSAYDALYVALAEHEGCDLWTADSRLVNQISPMFSRAHLLGEWKLGISDA